MVWQAEVLSPWLDIDVGDDSRRAHLGTTYVVDLSDITGQPSQNVMPSPNMMACYVRCEEAVLDAIEADADYYVLWAEEVLEDEV